MEKKSGKKSHKAKALILNVVYPTAQAISRLDGLDRVSPYRHCSLAFLGFTTRHHNGFSRMLRNATGSLCPANPKWPFVRSLPG